MDAADKGEAAASDHRWKAADLMVQAYDDGMTQKQIAEVVGLGFRYVGVYIRVVRRYGGLGAPTLD